MSIYNPPGGFDHADSDKIKVTPVFSDKNQPQEIHFKNLRLRSEKIVELQLLMLLQGKLEEILDTGKKQFSVSEEDLDMVLEKIKTHFQHLMVSDISQDYLYADDLSKNWHMLLKIIEMLEQSPKPPVFLGSLQLFVKKLMEYPKKGEHTLGYYLTEYAGENWIPFPFMDMLSGLHVEALIKKTKSTLHGWVMDLAEIIANIT